MGLHEKMWGVTTIQMGWFISDVAKYWAEQSVMSEAEDVGDLCVP